MEKIANEKLGFYQSVHSNKIDFSGGYGAASYNIISLFAMRAFRNFLKQKKHDATPIRILDVGCGKGIFLRDLVSKFASLNIPISKAIGVDLFMTPENVFTDNNNLEFLAVNLDGSPLPRASGEFDIVACNHVLEHIFETELLLLEIRRMLANGGLAVVSVPNIATWINRLLFLFGIQPLGSEVGTRSITYGFWPPFIKQKLKKWTPAGHIRDFTPRALRDICKECGLSVVGWWKQTNWTGRNIGVVLTAIQ